MVQADDPMIFIYLHYVAVVRAIGALHDERPHPRCPLPVDVKPSGSGDERSFHATIDATAGWEGYYRRWARTWDSPEPSEIVITDDYELASGEGVEFFWSTQLPVETAGRSAIIRGERGEAVVTAQEDATLRVDELQAFGGQTVHRIVIGRAGASGTLRTSVALRPVRDS